MPEKTTAQQIKGQEKDKTSRRATKDQSRKARGKLVVRISIRLKEMLLR